CAVYFINYVIDTSHILISDTRTISNLYDDSTEQNETGCPDLSRASLSIKMPILPLHSKFDFARQVFLNFCGYTKIAIFFIIWL
ncbi:MAG: hypothetical protein AAB875_01845, partial [Patescibacteria group bacterium]